MWTTSINTHLVLKTCVCKRRLQRLRAVHCNHRRHQCLRFWLVIQGNVVARATVMAPGKRERDNNADNEKEQEPDHHAKPRNLSGRCPFTVDIDADISFDTRVVVDASTDVRVQDHASVHSNLQKWYVVGVCQIVQSILKTHGRAAGLGSRLVEQ